MLSSHLVRFRCPVLDNNFPCHKVPKVYYAVFGYVTIKVSDGLPDCDTVQSYKRIPTSWKNILLPSSGFMCVMQEACSVIHSDSNRTHGRVAETGSQSMQIGSVDRKRFLFRRTLCFSTKERTGIETSPLVGQNHYFRGTCLYKGPDSTSYTF